MDSSAVDNQRGDEPCFTRGMIWRAQQQYELLKGVYPYEPEQGFDCDLMFKKMLEHEAENTKELSSEVQPAKKFVAFSDEFLAEIGRIRTSMISELTGDDKIYSRNFQEKQEPQGLQEDKEVAPNNVKMIF